MKRVSLLLLLFLSFYAGGTANSTHNIIEITNKKSTTVFICKGPNSKRYHNTANCQGLRNCSTEIYEVSLSDAESIGRTPCGFCY